MNLLEQLKAEQKRPAELRRLVGFRATDKQIAAMHEAARRSNVSINTFCLVAVAHAVERVLVAREAQ
jgi:uncharacterized protein (DUF1778 family)